MWVREQFEQYIIRLYANIPLSVYEGLLSVFCFGAVLLIVIYGFRKGWRSVVGLFLIEYVILIYCSTLVFRGVSEEIGNNYKLFWSYVAIQDGRNDLIPVNIMNVVVFIPVGIKFALLLLNKLKLFKVGLFTVGFGMVISASIETLQYILNRGFSELDDVFHNTLGCLIGFLMVAIIKGIWLLQKRY